MQSARSAEQAQWPKNPLAYQAIFSCDDGECRHEDRKGGLALDHLKTARSEVAERASRERPTSCPLAYHCCKTLLLMNDFLRSGPASFSNHALTSNYTFGAEFPATEDEMPNLKIGPRYRADITAGSLKVAESRLIADLLLQEVDAQAWNAAIVDRNILQARTAATARQFDPVPVGIDGPGPLETDPRR